MILKKTRNNYNKENKKSDMEIKAGEEADELMERIEKEACIARLALTSTATKTTPGNNGSAKNTSSNEKKEASGISNLERIKIPNFSGNKSEFPHWHATFISCVDQTSMTAQFKMLRLESCLTGEAWIFRSSL